MSERELDQIKSRENKLNELKKKGINPYPYSYERTHSSSDIRKNLDNLIEKPVSICGRLISKRIHGKAGFADIRDESDKIQVYFKYDTLKDDYELVSLIDVGDFIGVSGKVFKTKTGEPTIWVEKLIVLSKSVHPLPEKWHGLQDIEARYRYRYLDLLMNQEVKEIFKKRSEIIRLIRSFFDKMGFLEVETPILQNVYGGAFATPFLTHHKMLDMKFYLRISDELYLKRLIIGGYDKVYEMGKDFRNEGLDRFHNPEFTMLEAYTAYADYTDVMKLVENLFLELVKNLNNGNECIDYQGNEISFSIPWKKIGYFDAIKEKTGIDFIRMDFGEAASAASKLGIDVKNKFSRGKILDAIFSKFVESDLIQPTFVIDYPKDITPLAKEKRGNSELVERFEPFIAGMEVGNAYSELNDPYEQEKRFIEQQNLREKGEQEAQAFDKNFLEAMQYGMPPLGGLGLGIDRIVMIFVNASSIRDVIFFPQMKNV